MRTWILVPVACGAMLAAAPGRAQPPASAAAPAAAAAPTASPPAAPALETQRVLDGHVFQPTFLARTPFPATAFDVKLVYGLGEATGPKYDLNGDVRGERTYSFAAIGQSFAYEKVLADGVSAAAGLVTSLYSGTDSVSALVVGADIQVGVAGRVTAARRLGPVQAALTLDASYGPRLGIVVIDAVKDALDADAVDEGGALDLKDVLTLQPGVAAAWAPHPAVGVTASADYQWISLDEETGSSSGQALGFGIAADLDMMPLYDVPVALLAAVHVVAPIAGDDVSTILDFSVGAFYTAKPALILGAEIGWREFEIRPDLDSSATLAQIRASYLW